MESKSLNKKNTNLLFPFKSEKTFEISIRLEERNYPKPLELLKNWNLLRAFIINKPKLNFDFIHLLDK